MSIPTKRGHVSGCRLSVRHTLVLIGLFVMIISRERTLPVRLGLIAPYKERRCYLTVQIAESVSAPLTSLDNLRDLTNSLDDVAYQLEKSCQSATLRKNTVLLTISALKSAGKGFCSLPEPKKVSELMRSE